MKKIEKFVWCVILKTELFLSYLLRWSGNEKYIKLRIIIFSSAYDGWVNQASNKFNQ